MPQISQKQIAEHLGFSQSLVSKVLNNRGAKVPLATIRKIWDYAREHGYRPRGIDLDLLVADSVATRMVGFVLRSPLRLTSGTHIFLHAHEGMHHYLRERNALTVFLGTEGEINPSMLAVTLHRQRLLLGLVLMGDMQPDFVQQIAHCGKPVVFVSGRMPGVAHSVSSNFSQAGEQLVDHLYRLGHRRFAWIGSGHSLASLSRHKSAFVAALQSHGLELAPSCDVVRSEANRLNGHTAAQQIMAANRRSPPTAIVCFNGMLARGAINAFFQAGYRVPDDFSVAAFDMTFSCTEEPPSITGATSPPEQLGARAAELVLSRADSEDHSLCDLALPTVLAINDSTGPAPTRRPARR